MAEKPATLAPDEAFDATLGERVAYEKRQTTLDRHALAAVRRALRAIECADRANAEASALACDAMRPDSVMRTIAVNDVFDARDTRVDLAFARKHLADAARLLDDRLTRNA